MVMDSLVSLFQKLPSSQKALFLSVIAHNLTILARDTYVAGTDAVADPKRLKAFNELQHKLMGQLLAILLDEENRYPDDVFFAMVFDMATQSGLTAELNHSAKEAIDIIHNRPAGS